MTGTRVLRLDFCSGNEGFDSAQEQICGVYEHVLWSHTGRGSPWIFVTRVGVEGVPNAVRSVSVTERGRCTFVFLVLRRRCRLTLPDLHRSG